MTSFESRQKLRKEELRVEKTNDGLLLALPLLYPDVRTEKTPANPLGLTGGTSYVNKCQSWHLAYLQHSGCQIQVMVPQIGRAVADCCRELAPFNGANLWIEP